MTIREVKNYLNRGYYIQKEINNLKERLARLWQEINNAVPSYGSDGTQFNPDITSKEKKLAVYEDSKDTIEQKIIELEELDNETEKLIEQMSTSEYRLILRLRHIDRKNWKQIQREIHLSRSSTFDRYTDSLEEFREVLER